MNAENHADKDVSKWLRLADMDLSSAHHLFETHRPMPVEIVCFLSQQAAEKMSKAFLVTHDVKYPKNHELRRLCEMCIKIEEEFKVLQKESAILTHYGVLPRYPDEIELVEHDAATAIKCADKIMDFVRTQLQTEEQHEVFEEPEEGSEYL